MSFDDQYPTGRIVVLAEMSDGSIKAFDGFGQGELRVDVDYATLDETYRQYPIQRRTTLEITYYDTVLFYDARQPPRPDSGEIEERKQIEQ